MDRAATDENAPDAGSPLSAPAATLAYERVRPTSSESLLKVVLALALPSLLEQIFNFLVGLNDTWLANNLPPEGGRDVAPAATAAVGTISYLLWFIGLIVGAVGTGSTALISRAKGARHRRLANSVCGQSVTAALLLGVVLAIVLYAWAPMWIRATRLNGDAVAFALSYLRMLAWSLPFLTVMLAANACLRGAGDTLTPAVSMILVNLVNMGLSFGLTYGWWGLPRMGFDGIALGTVIAYVVGGLLQFGVLVSGLGAVRLHWHRLAPHWHTLRRVLRVGVPAGVEGLLIWLAQFTIVIVINQMDGSNVAAAAHLNAVKIEAFSYLPGFAFATAAATLVGQSLGMKDPLRAKRGTHLAYALGGGVMTLCGVVFVLWGRTLAEWMLPRQPEIAALTARCLFVTGFIQSGFAASMIFSGALRGAGDTLVVMGLNLFSTIVLRLLGVLVVVFVFKQGLVAVWCVLAVELFLRGIIIFMRFEQGAWRHLEV
jgi:putative MATE family efflux protein